MAGCDLRVRAATLGKEESLLAIDPEFQKRRKRIDKEEGIAIWGPVDPPDKLGICGTFVAVDWHVCRGCGTCPEVCPVQMREWI